VSHVSLTDRAVADRVLASSPCTGVWLPEVEKPQIAPWEVDRVEAIVNAIPGRYKSLVTFGAGTGVRISEALGLTLDRVDFLRRTVRIDRQLAPIPFS